MKRLILGALFGIFAAISPVYAQGTVPVALTQQVSSNGQPLVGCLFYTFVVGTVSTPQNSYQDTGLSLLNPWPLPCDQNGRVPMFYLANGSVHVRLTDSAGNIQFDYPSMLVIGASSGSGGGGSVDPTTIASTGDIKYRLTSETLTGWVRLNGRTIGSASSGATERANADTQALFVYLWTNCTNAHCPVSSGRGSTAVADFSANKTITLPNMQDKTPVGRDCMGATCAGILLAGNISSGGGDGVDTPLATGGQPNQFTNGSFTIAQTNLPNVNFTVSGIALHDPGHTHGDPGGGNFQTRTGTDGTNGLFYPASGSQNARETGATASSTTGITVSSQGTAASGGSGTAVAFTTNLFPNMPPFALVTWYQKL